MTDNERKIAELNRLYDETEKDLERYIGKEHLKKFRKQRKNK